MLSPGDLQKILYMPKANEDWIVYEHGPLVQAEENLYHLEGALPKMALRRRMTIARRTDGGLVIHNAIAVEEALMTEIESLGPVRFVVVPNSWHRLDAPNFRRRFPDATFLCPPGGRKKIEAVVAIDGTYRDFPPDEFVQLEVLDGLKGAEGVMKVRSEAGTSLIFNDSIFNVPRLSGFDGLVMRLLGSTGGPKVTRLMRLLAVKDKAAFQAGLEQLSETPDLLRIIPGHGNLIETDASSVMRTIAARL